jgi:peptidoglycan/xylan/chitin deacetylase (PgdA/CDA1 family)
MAFRVALTFDAEHPDRPSRPDATSHVLDALAVAAVRGTFFIQGRWAEAEPDLARRIAGEGHLVGNHSHYHARMPLLTPAGMRTDIRAAERVIRRVTGVDPRPWFRFPFGAGMEDPALLGILTDLGYRSAGWDVDALDWRVAASGAGVARTIVAEAVAHGDGTVVLQHPWSSATRQGIGGVIAGLREAGATLVRLDELPGAPA